MALATDGSGSEITRRQALKRGAVVGAAAAWTVPAIQVVSLTAAHADSPSAPPENPPPSRPPTNPPPYTPPNTPPTKPPTGHTPPPAGHSTPPASTPPAPAGGGGGGGVSTGELPNTGLSLPLVPTIAVAAGMIATGIAAQAARPQPAVVEVEQLEES